MLLCGLGCLMIVEFVINAKQHFQSAGGYFLSKPELMTAEESLEQMLRAEQAELKNAIIKSIMTALIFCPFILWLKKVF